MAGRVAKELRPLVNELLNRGWTFGTSGGTHPYVEEPGGGRRISLTSTNGRSSSLRQKLRRAVRETPLPAARPRRQEAKTWEPWEPAPAPAPTPVRRPAQVDRVALLDRLGAKRRPKKVAVEVERKEPPMPAPSPPKSDGTCLHEPCPYPARPGRYCDRHELWQEAQRRFAASLSSRPG